MQKKEGLSYADPKRINSGGAIAIQKKILETNGSAFRSENVKTTRNYGVMTSGCVQLADVGKNLVRYFGALIARLEGNNSTV